jgi:formate dehydrogenase subunit gamma
MGCCLLTGATLYLPPLAQLVGRRPLVETIHLYAGLALPVPMLAAAASAGYRRDLRALNRFTAADHAWLRASLRFGSWRRAAARARVAGGVGKFNAGQKLFAAFVAGGAFVMLGTGVIMQWGAGPLGPIPIGYRTGATFVHDLLAYGLFFGVVGHLWMAAHDPVARVGMRTGTVPAWWAAREHPAWSPGAAGRPRPRRWAKPGTETAAARSVVARDDRHDDHDGDDVDEQDHHEGDERDDAPAPGPARRGPGTREIAGLQPGLSLGGVDDRHDPRG